MNDMSFINTALREDGFIANIVRDPREPPDTLFLMGFVGRAADPGMIRLYLDVQVIAYVDVPETDLLHAEPIPPSQSPLGGHYVWVLRSSATMVRLREAQLRLSQVQQDTALNLQLTSISALGSLPSGWPTTPSGLGQT